MLMFTRFCNTDQMTKETLIEIKLNIEFTYITPKKMFTLKQEAINLPCFVVTVEGLVNNISAGWRRPRIAPPRPCVAKVSPAPDT